MNPLPQLLPDTPTSAPTGDADLAEQAQPGHGVPSQDPDAAAQSPLEPHDVEREANSVLTGGGVVIGMATGAAVGVALAGPVGVVVGATLGAVAGALGGAAASEAVQTDNAREPETRPADAIRLHIDDSGGAGRTIVLIHGWPLSGQAWALQAPALEAAGYRVVTYDRRGFGQSDKPVSDYSYDVLADDLQYVLDRCGVQDVTLVGFSMGGGEVARYISRHGESRLHSVVFAAAVTPYLLKTSDNPEGPLEPEHAQHNRLALAQDRSAYFEEFTRNFFTAQGVMMATEPQRRAALALCHLSAPHAALACMDAFSNTDFRADLKAITVPTLVIHGEADAIVPLEGSGRRTHAAVTHSEMVRIAGAPHGLNVTHPNAFNAALLKFLKAGAYP